MIVIIIVMMIIIMTTITIKVSQSNSLCKKIGEGVKEKFINGRVCMCASECVIVTR